MKILHISDIHWTKRRHWEEDYLGMKSKFRDDIKEYIEAGNQIDYVFICGDVVFKGIKEEYDKALSYIDDLCGIIGCSRKEVFVVPGNHDLSRDFAAHQQREMMNAALAFEPSNNSFLDNVIPKSKELRKTQFDAFKDYNDFAKVFLCHEKVIDKCINGSDDAITDNDELFYHTQLTKKVGDFTVSVRGVNTAFSKAYILESGKFDDNPIKNNLYIDKSAVDAVVEYGVRKGYTQVWQEMDEELRLLIPYDKNNLNEVVIGFAFDINMFTSEVKGYSTRVYKLLKLFPYDEPVNEFCFDLRED